VYSCYGFANFVDVMGTAHPYDGLVVHPYAHLKGKMSALDYHDKAMQAPQELCAVVQKLQEYMRAKVGPQRARQMSVVVSEYGISAKSRNMPTPEYLG